MRKCLVPGSHAVVLTDVCRGGHEGDVSEPLREQGVRARSRACHDGVHPPP